MSASKQKGTAFETSIVNYLRNWYSDAKRNPPAGNKDVGDIGGLPGVVVECKNVKAMNLSGWVNEANVERDNAGALAGVVIHKRKGKGDPADQYVTMDLETFVKHFL